MQCQLTDLVRLSLRSAWRRPFWVIVSFPQLRARDVLHFLNALGSARKAIQFWRVLPINSKQECLKAKKMSRACFRMLPSSTVRAQKNQRALEIYLNVKRETKAQ
jgi:hypothetical protein